MEKRIVLFHYYSARSFPAGCYLDLLSDVAYRNMFLEPCGGNKIHFEFPMFEDHSYNSICNGNVLIDLLQQPRKCNKYIIFRTKNKDTNKCNIIGYYRVGSAFYQESDYFNKNGFIWSIIADEVHLIKKGAIELEGSSPGRGIPRSWSRNSNWYKKLNNFLLEIKKHRNLTDKYQSETTRLVKFFKDKKVVQEWKENCLKCIKKNKCNFFRRNKYYKPDDPKYDLFYIMNMYYTENHYSRNLLETIPKIQIMK